MKHDSDADGNNGSDRETVAKKVRTLSGIIARAFIVWGVLICAEILHGIARGIFLVPYVGEFRSNQIGVFTGSVIILVIALAFVRWIGATQPAQLLMVGCIWLGLLALLLSPLIAGRVRGCVLNQ